jgi:ribosome biogenesis protein NSA1
MPRFLVGDELGNIKSVQYNPASQETSKSVLKTLHDGTATGRAKGIQKLALSNAEENILVRLACPFALVNLSSNAEGKLSAAHANGAVSIFSLNEDDQLELLQEWKETRIRTDQSFIGLAASGG